MKHNILKSVASAFIEAYLFVHNANVYKTRRTKLEECRVVDIMGDTLYYDYDKMRK